MEENRTVSTQDVYSILMYSGEEWFKATFPELDYWSAYIHEFIFDENGHYIVLSSMGKLYKVSFFVDSNNDIIFDNIEQVKVEYVKTNANITFYRQKDDTKLKYMAIAAASVLNRSGEIDTSDLFQDFENNFEEPVPLTFYHIYNDNFFLGTVESVARFDNFLISIGYIDVSTKLGRYAEENLLNGNWGLSIGFYPDFDKVNKENIGGIEITTYSGGKLKEISILLEKDAASLFTTIKKTDENKERGKMDKNSLIKKLTEWTGSEEAANEFFNSIEVVQSEIRSQQMIARDNLEGKEVFETSDVVEEKAEQKEEEEEFNEIEVENEVEQTFEIDDEVINEITELVIQSVDKKYSDYVKISDEKIAKLEAEIIRLTSEVMSSVEQFEQRVSKVERSEDNRLLEMVNDLPSNRRATVLPRITRKTEAQEESDNPINMELKAYREATEELNKLGGKK